MPEGKIEFIQFHLPSLKDGHYQITVEQKIAANGIPNNTSFSTTKYFQVAGERFRLKPTDIHAVFPPDGNLGEYSNVLPQIILKRSTLPWERVAENEDKENQGVPWLALLLFNEEEKPTPQIITLGELQTKNCGYSVSENKPDDNEKITIIEVKKDILEKIMPSTDELALMAHVRQRDEAAEVAVLMTNRLPEKGSMSTMHLVSVENRYTTGTFDYKNDEPICLVSLKSWNFSCLNKKYNFDKLLTHLNQVPSTLRLPKNNNPEAEKYLAMGYVPLSHALRQGKKTVSWYHGPLITGQNLTDDLTLPIRAADQLVRYNPSNGLFDISYAAAWELGRLLALQSKSFSINLYNWKRTHVQQIKQEEQQLIYPYLPPPNKSSTSQLLKSIENWFNGLSLLKGIPFNYLVPDETMLPTESLRFFYVDPLWVACLLDGAFSIGRVITSDHQQDSAHSKNPATNPFKDEIVTGFLLRSEVVAGWPDLQVDAYDKIDKSNDVIPDADKLPRLRMDRLSPDVLLCLFKGEVKMVDIHEKPEALHFGFDVNENNQLYKELRNSKGEEQENLEINNVPWHNKDERVVDISTLANDIKTTLAKKPITFKDGFTSAQFALEMIEGVEKVRFGGQNS